MMDSCSRLEMLRAYQLQDILGKYKLFQGLFPRIDKGLRLWKCSECNSRNIYMNKYCNRCGKIKEEKQDNVQQRRENKW